MRTLEPRLSAPNLAARPGLNPSSEQPGPLTGQTVLARSIRSVPHAVVNLEAQEKAKNLIREGDRELARQFAATLMERASSPSPQALDHPTAQTVSNIPPYSTFGQAWSRFTNALKTEPFVTFAQRNNIDTTRFRLDPSARWLECTVNGKPMLFTPYTPGWSQASASVTAAARELVPTLRGAFKFDGEGSVPLDVISDFYASAYGPTKADLLFAIGMLQQLDSFTSLLPPASDSAVHDSPLYQRVRQVQQETIEALALELSQSPRSLPPQQKNMTPAQRIDEADRTLAQTCSRALASWHDETRRRGAGILKQAAPSEDSTFGAQWQAFENALSTDSFFNFARAKGIETSSISIDPVSGTLSASVRGTRTDFTTSDASGWSAVAPQILDLARSLAAGASDPLSHPRFHHPSINQILNFYAEITPDTLQETLKQCAALNRAGFNALRKDNPPTDEQSRVVQKKQNDLKLKLDTSIHRPVSEVQAPTPAPTGTRASGDSALAVLVSDTMLALKRDNSDDASRVIENIPGHSTFGQWWSHITQAFEGRALTQWAQQQKIDTSTLVFDPATNALTAKANGVDRFFLINDFAHDYPELFDALTPLADAANVLVPFSQPIKIAKPSSTTAAPFALVFNFYGGNTGDLSSPGFVKLAHDMKRAKAFPDLPADPTRSEAALKNQKMKLGNNNDRYALASRLKLAFSGTRLDHSHMRVDSNSSHYPKGIRTAEQFITDNSWKVPRNKDELSNLLLALRTPVPQREPLADLWGFLSTPIPLTTAQREQVAQVVRTHLGTSTGLFNYLSPTSDSLGTDLKQNLEQLLSSDKAQALGQALQTQLKGFPTSSSISQWILTALVLELDPKADDKRNSIAGFDFMQSGNWGRPASELLGKFTQHLTDTHKVGSAIAPTAVRVLLSGKAPQFLVKELPSTLTYGTPAWTSFHTAVNRIEQMAPGASTSMTYRQVMDFHKVSPLSKEEERHLARAQMNPVIDWGVINDVIPKNDKDEYDLENVQLCLDQLNQQEKETAAAVRYLSRTHAPTRRSMALENLKAKFGPDIPYEESNLRRPNDSTSQDRWASVVELYEAKQLGDVRWETDDARIPIQHLRDQAGELPDINTQFDTAINDDYATRRTHSVVAIKDLLSKLPLEDRNHLNYGQISYYSVRESDTSFWQHLQAKKGKKGSHGILVRAVHKGVVHDYAIFPDVAIVKKIPNLPDPMPIGGTNKVFGKIYDGADEGTHALPLDFTAFTSAATPREGVTSNVIVDPVDARVRIGNEMVDHRVTMVESTYSMASPTYFSDKFDNIAKTVVDSHFLRKDEFEALHRGRNAFETASMTFLERLNFLARMVPGVSSIEDVIEGKYAQAGIDLLIDALSIAVPAGIGKVWTLAGEAVERVAANTAKNLLIEGVAEETAEAAATFKDMSAFTAAQESTPLSRMQNRNFQAETNTLLTRPDITDGTIIQNGVIHEQTKLTAVYREGFWYAYDVQTKTAYGTPLQGFVSDASMPLAQETFSDGTRALVTEKPLSEQAYIIRRSSGWDVIDGDKVYRYDPKNPGQLTDLESADHYKELDNFEAFCPAPSMDGGRVRRGANDECFVRDVSNISSELGQELQALEHTRLYPSPRKLFNKDRFVVFERRVHQMVETETGTKLVPLPNKSHVNYKSLINAKFVEDKSFGFYGGTANEFIEKETRVVKLEAISDACNDSRELRGVVVSSPLKNDAAKYLVIEADTGEFYYSKLMEPQTSESIFIKCTARDFDKALAKKYREKLYIRQTPAGASVDANLISLPKLNSVYKDLEKAGYSKSDIEKLKTRCAAMTPEQKREVAYQLQQRGATGKADIALKPNQVRPLTKPGNFNNLTLERQNKFYAEQAKLSVDRSLKATGLGPGNIVRTPADLARADAANTALNWLRETRNARALNTGTMTVKSGAGNCGEMSNLSKEIINSSGGNAYGWFAGNAHAFTVVGGPTTLPRETVDFSEAIWKDAWIVDPWADIACPASEYTQTLDQVMHKWDTDGLKIREGTNPNMSPLDPKWIDTLINQPKMPYREGYNQPRLSA